MSYLYYLMISFCCLISLLIAVISKYSFTMGTERRINDKEAINEKAISDNPASRVGLLNSDCHVLSLKGEMNNILYFLNFINKSIC